MNLIFLGAPGVGKGTQARILSEKLKIPHISTGEIFRDNMTNHTKLGEKIRGFMDAGLLVPDDIVIDVITDRLSNEDCVNGYILDGVPRTIPQAEYLETKIKIDKVVNFTLSDAEIVKRLSGRRTCEKCGFAHHIEYIPPMIKGVCDKCGGKLVQRSDETSEAVQKRLNEYNEKTAQLISFYTEKGLILNIDASPSIEEIHKTVCEKLEIKCD